MKIGRGAIMQGGVKGERTGRDDWYWGLFWEAIWKLSAFGTYGNNPSEDFRDAET